MGLEPTSQDVDARVNATPGLSDGQIEETVQKHSSRKAEGTFHSFVTVHVRLSQMMEEDVDVMVMMCSTVSVYLKVRICLQACLATSKETKWTQHKHGSSCGLSNVSVGHVFMFGALVHPDI